METSMILARLEEDLASAEATRLALEASEYPPMSGG